MPVPILALQSPDRRASPNRSRPPRGSAPRRAARPSHRPSAAPSQPIPGQEFGSRLAPFGSSRARLPLSASLSAPGPRPSAAAQRDGGPAAGGGGGCLRRDRAGPIRTPTPTGFQGQYGPFPPCRAVAPDPCGGPARPAGPARRADDSETIQRGARLRSPPTPWTA